jgi:hypothetical protein
LAKSQGICFTEIINQIKGGEAMPTLQHLLEELGLLKVKPKSLRLSARLYDDLVEDAQESSEESSEEETE